MTLRDLMVRDVTIRRAGTTTDRYGNLLPDWTTATETTTTGWLGVQTRSEEGGTRIGALIQGGTLVLDDLTLDVAGGDRVDIDGITFEVDGPPLTAWTPRGAHHLEVTVRAVTG